MKLIYTQQSYESLEESIQFLLKVQKIPLEKVLEIKSKLLNKADSLEFNPHKGHPYRTNEFDQMYYSGPSLGYIVNRLKTSWNGGSWTSGGGFDNFGSDNEARAAGFKYNERHNSWSGTNFSKYRNLYQFNDGGGYFQINENGKMVIPYTNKPYDFGTYNMDQHEGSDLSAHNESTSSDPAFGHSFSDWVDVAAAQAMIFGAGFDVSSWEKPKYMPWKKFKSGQTVAKGVSRRLSVAGAVISVSQAIHNPTGGNMVDATFGIIGAIPHPITTRIGGAYFATDLLLMGSKGKGISDHIDSYVWIANPTVVGFIPVMKIPGK